MARNVSPSENRHVFRVMKPTLHGGVEVIIFRVCFINEKELKIVQREIKIMIQTVPIQEWTKRIFRPRDKKGAVIANLVFTIKMVETIHGKWYSILFRYRGESFPRKWDFPQNMNELHTVYLPGVQPQRHQSRWNCCRI
ncbi:hypothetical protein AVEN_29246-1 [Araneus ventricosus]|uniref:Uncharacterized protein n=1 Tax=Araneus ventricosus TaxID=182803 RepID=A0A4Y2DY30_ARAVE|nr:hypothetical protein AVEN_29246-1 [Araneus ventricosus]